MKSTLKSLLFWLASLLLWELILYLAAFGSPGWRELAAIVSFSLGAAALLTLLDRLTGRTWLGWVLAALLYLVFSIQLVYRQVFGSFLSLAFVSMGGEAITNFLPIVFSAIWARLPLLAAFALPLIARGLLLRRSILPKTRAGWPWLAGLLAAFALFTWGTGLALPLLGDGTASPAALYANGSATAEQWSRRLGLLTAERLDLQRLLTGGGGTQLDSSVDLTAGGEGERNILSAMDFDVLREAAAEDRDLTALTEYFAALEGTEKNAYTGLFSGYNLIVVCAEAFSPYLIDPELTPALYRMSTEGIVFQNFYNSFANLTTNGEYALNMGLLPDMSRMSFASSIQNYLPFCMGRIFRQAGYSSLAYHNNIATFYNRVNTHTNMGYTFKAQDFGLDLASAARTPSSDLELMEVTLPDYLDQEPFHAYYMTYSGHAPYSWENNAMSEKNRALTEGLDGSEELRAYYACQLELEQAMEFLLSALEEAGIAQRTVVVLTGDHMPYGLSQESYAQLAAGHTDEPFWQYRNAFLCWTGGLEEPLVVDAYCSTHDILPTLLNLFGLPYDSRLLTGVDILSSAAHTAILEDGSFLTEDMVYDAVEGTVTWRGEPGDSQLVSAVANQFSVAAAILDTDYYRFAFSALDIMPEEEDRELYASYADISGAWYEEDVELLTAHGALSGGGDGSFRGEDAASRADLLAMVTRTLHLTGTSCGFTDVEAGDWYYDIAAAAWTAGLLTEDTALRPLDPVTPAEAAELLTQAARCAELPIPDTWGDEVVARSTERTGGAVTRGAAAAAVAELIRAMEARS